MKRAVPVGLALSGGGVRGVAHIGVLEAITQLPLKVDRIAGTSAGGIVGAMYAATGDPGWIEQRFRDFLTSESFRRLGMDRLAATRSDEPPWLGFAQRLRDHVILNVSLVKAFAIKKMRLTDALAFLVPARRFEDLSIPLTVVATDLVSGLDVFYERGDLIEALTRSASIPGFLEPTRDGDALLVDGGVTNPMPAARLRESCDYVLAVDIGRPPGECKPPLNMYELMVRAEAMKHQRLHRQQLADADFVIRPEVGDVHWSRFDLMDMLIEAGQAAGTRAAEPLLESLRGHASGLARLRRGVARIIGERRD